MLIKHLPLVATGDGAGAGAISYVLREQDAKGMIRAEVKVLRGDPHIVGEIIDSLSFVHCYTSSVIAFAPEDKPTDKQLNAVLDDYLKLSFAGLDPTRFASCAVLHREDNGGCHVHVISARVDLVTGLSFNPAPPGHQYEFDQIVHHHNYLHGWARPDDPERARTCSKGHLNYKDAAALKKGLAVEPDRKQAITDYLEQGIVLGLITNRQEIKAALEEIGDITREGQNYISVKPEGHERAIRLKGSIYEQGFDSEVTAKTGRGPAASRGVDIKKSANARSKFNECCRKRAAFNRVKYCKSSKRDQQQSKDDTGGSEQGNGTDQQFDTNDVQAVLVGIDNDPVDLDYHLRGQLGSDALLVERGFEEEERVTAARRLENRSAEERGINPFGDDRKARLMAESTGCLGDRDQGEISNEKNESHIKQYRKWRYNDQREGSGDGLQVLSKCHLAHYSDAKTSGILSLATVPGGRANVDLRRGGNAGAQRAGEKLNERGDGDDLAGPLGKSERATRELDRAYTNLLESERTNRALDETSAELNKAGRSLAATANRCFPRIGEIVVNCADELSRFKSEINLSAYLADQGYQLDKKKSCTSYAVMRKGVEKLVVTRAPDGHYVYTDAHNDRDCGSIIDYIQNRRALNLGQVRKELRPWIGTGRLPASIENYQPTIEKSPADYARIATSWSNAGEVRDYSYLASRGIERETVEAYSDRIRQSAQGTLMFQHLDPHSPVSGYEFKAQGYAGFSKGGRKGLFIARRSEARHIRRLVITETALDALSYAQLEGCKKDVAYVSTGGNFSDEQIEQLKAIVRGLGLEMVITAHDNDKGGHDQAEKLRERLQNSCSIERHTPPRGNDWNEELQDTLKREPSSPGLR